MDLKDIKSHIKSGKTVTYKNADYIVKYCKLTYAKGDFMHVLGLVSIKSNSILEIRLEDLK